MRAVAYAMLDFLREDPERARLMVVESVAAGPRPRAIREQGMAALAALIDAGRAELDDPGSVPASTAEVTAGAIYNRLHQMVEEGSWGEAEAAVPELMYTAVLPYMGTEAALEELDLPRP